MTDTLRKYALRWTERITEHDGFGDESGVVLEDRTIVIEATSCDDAHDKWDAEYSNDGTNGLHSLHRIVDHPFLTSYIKVENPLDTDSYAVAVDFLIREHATSEVYKDPSKNEDDIAEHIEQHTIALFENNRDALLEWAKTHTDWDDLIDSNAVKRIKSNKPPVDRSTYWKKGSHTFLDTIG